jgi:hypothetical protein
MRFIHYSDLGIITKVQYPDDGPDHRGTKPPGLWFSVVSQDGSDSWKHWCEKNSRQLGTYRTEIVFRPDARLLWLDDADVIGGLTNAFRYFPDCPDWQRSNPVYTRSAIRWERMAKKYDGVILTDPRCFEPQNKGHWYFTWDCASGCVWSPTPVAKLKPL